MICPVCEQENGELVPDAGPWGDEFLMCRPCQQVTDIVEDAPLDAYMPLCGERVGAWMRRLQLELGVLASK